MVFPKPLFLPPTRFTTCSILGTQMYGFHPLCLAPYWYSPNLHLYCLGL